MRRTPAPAGARAAAAPAAALAFGLQAAASMQHDTGAPDDSGQECANCGHAARFHETKRTSSGPGAPSEGTCSSPEDGTPCPCPGYEPVVQHGARDELSR